MIPLSDESHAHHSDAHGCRHLTWRHPPKAYGVRPAQASPTDSIPVTIRVDAARTKSELRPIWRFFGADEPNYAYMKDGQKLLAELGGLCPQAIYFRTHNLLTTATGGLVAKGGGLKHFAVAGANKEFVWAEAKTDGETVVVSSPQVGAPEAVRYAWSDNPEGCNLYNAAGLPAAPFRTDK